MDDWVIGRGWIGSCRTHAHRSIMEREERLRSTLVCIGDTNTHRWAISCRHEDRVFESELCAEVAQMIHAHRLNAGSLAEHIVNSEKAVVVSVMAMEQHKRELVRLHSQLQLVRQELSEVEKERQVYSMFENKSAPK